MGRAKSSAVGSAENAGALIMTGLPGPELDPQTRRRLLDLAPSGIILYRHNVRSASQVRALIRQLHALPSRPLVAVDHEGGRVMRLGAPFTSFPAAAVLGRTGRPELARRVGAAMARELASVGFDIDFAPVCDVNSNPANPVIGERSFGADPRLVGSFARQFWSGLREGGVLGCAKHFPGHGDTEQDSHTDVPVVRRSRASLEATEIPPFRTLIRAGIPIVMTAHVVYPAFDRCVATFSRRIVSGLLREGLGFRGVIASDDLEMAGAACEGGIGEAAVRALQAGVDWVLVCLNLDQALEARDAIVRATAQGRLDPADLHRSAARIRRLHRRLRTLRRTDKRLRLPVRAHAALDATVRALGAAAGRGD